MTLPKDAYADDSLDRDFKPEILSLQKITELCTTLYNN